MTPEHDSAKIAYGWTGPNDTCAHKYLLPLVTAMLPRAPARVIDLGSGNGYVGGLLASRGYDVTGVEISDDGIKVARLAHPALKFIHASVYDDVRQDAGKSFDVALAIEAIEHLYSPRIFLRHAFGLLRPGGMIVTTPYHGYWKSLALSHAGRWDRHFTVGWDGGHIKFFSLRTLRLMLAEQGFVDVRAWYAGRLPYL